MDGAGGNPGSGGFDPCECIVRKFFFENFCWIIFLLNKKNALQMNHERAMNRLTDILRNAQTTCTDTECFTGPCKIKIKYLSRKYFYVYV